jgi:integrase/recombinase XerC
MNIDTYLESLRTKSGETARAYSQTLTRFESFLREKGLRVTQVKPSTIDAFVTHLSQNRGRTKGEQLAPATIARQLAVLSSYFTHLGDNTDGKIKNPVLHVKRPPANNDIPRAVDDLTLSTLIDGITDLRDKAIILTFVYSGLRLSELRQLNKDSILAKKRTAPDGSTQYFGCTSVIGKGEKYREVLVGPKAITAVAEYLRAYRRSDNDPALFLSSRQKRISSRAIEQVLDKWCKRLGVNHVHVHQLRHCFATRNINAGMSLSVLQSLLGHRYPETTGRYFRIQSDRKTREYFSAMEYLGDTSSV